MRKLRCILPALLLGLVLLDGSSTFTVLRDRWFIAPRVGKLNGSSTIRASEPSERINELLTRRDVLLISGAVGTLDVLPSISVDGPTVFYTDKNITNGSVLLRDLKEFMPFVTNFRLRSKLPKMFSHTLHPEFKAYAWADASFSATDGFVDELLESLGTADAAFAIHPWRQSVMDELIFMEDEIKRGFQYIAQRYAGLPLRKQVLVYEQMGFPVRDHIPRLLAGGLFIRRNTPQVNAAFDEWFVHNVAFSVQDQLSLPYVLWKHTLKIGKIPHIYPGRTYKYVGHSNEI